MKTVFDLLRIDATNFFEYVRVHRREAVPTNHSEVRLQQLPSQCKSTLRSTADESDQQLSVMIRY